ncbi:MAG: hypothetical protein KDD31_10355, partial [Muricauda sp.]|nr:hypothetical protein [Allomuricauda sp.]
MKIKYQLSKSDFLEHQLYGSSKSESHNRKRRNNRIIVPIIFLVYGYYLSYKRGNYVGIILSAVWGTLWFLFYPKYSKWRYKRHFENHVAENYKNRIDKTVDM